jgi:hypothetical protein
MHTQEMKNYSKGIRHIKEKNEIGENNIDVRKGFLTAPINFWIMLVIH